MPLTVARYWAGWPGQAGGRVRDFADRADLRNLRPADPPDLPDLPRRSTRRRMNARTNWSTSSDPTRPSSRSPTCRRRSNRSSRAWAARSKDPKHAGFSRPPQARLRNRTSQGRHLRPQVIKGGGDARARARSPAEGDRGAAAPSDRPRGRGSDQGGARAHASARKNRAAAVSRAGCRRNGSRVKVRRRERSDDVETSTVSRRRRNHGTNADEEQIRVDPVAATRRGADDKKADGKQGPAARAVPPPQGLQVLRGQDRRHQLQGRQAAERLRPRARQGAAAPHLGHVRETSARRCASRSCGRVSWRCCRTRRI